MNYTLNYIYLYKYLLFDYYLIKNKIINTHTYIYIHIPHTYIQSVRARARVLYCIKKFKYSTKVCVYIYIELN
jgi:hypothetical protein